MAVLLPGRTARFDPGFIFFFMSASDCGDTGAEVVSGGEEGRDGADGPPGLLSQPIKTKNKAVTTTQLAPVRMIQKARVRMGEAP